MTLRPARELAQQLANSSGLSFDARVDDLTAVIEADRREVVEAASKDVYAIANKLARFGDENGVATGELVDELNELGTRIRAIAIAKEETP